MQEKNSLKVAKGIIKMTLSKFERSWDPFSLKNTMQWVDEALFNFRILFVEASTSFSVAEGLQMLFKMQDFATALLFPYLPVGPDLSCIKEELPCSYTATQGLSYFYDH